jgi:hypothetical protein
MAFVTSLSARFIMEPLFGVKSCRLADGFLLVAGQLGEAVREGVGDAKFHQA